MNRTDNPREDFMNAIEITGLKKSFGDIKAVDDISFL